MRHRFFRMVLASQPQFTIPLSICEGEEGRLVTDVLASSDSDAIEKEHLLERINSENDFFSLFVEHTTDNSNPLVINRNQFNNDLSLVEKIKNIEPDFIVSYGCSIIREPLISTFEGKFINIHLGLSPYYKGAGTNFWPFVNGEPQFAGVTYMLIDKGVDTGSVLHQIRPVIYENDSLHSIGNRLIRDMALNLKTVLENFENITSIAQWPHEQERIYKKKDYNSKAVLKMRGNFKNGMISQYLKNKVSIDDKFPIVSGIQ
jgi:phosphoribosylglycinamide formyltransferase-1